MSTGRTRTPQGERLPFHILCSKMPSQSHVRILCIIGIILSCYAIYVEHRKSSPQSDNFTALCDLPSIGASCSKALMLPEGIHIERSLICHSKYSFFSHANILYYKGEYFPIYHLFHVIRLLMYRMH